MGAMRYKILSAVLVSTALACSADVGNDGEHVGAARAAAATTPPGRLTVMTRNMYLGAELDSILAAESAEQVPGLVASAWAQMIGNNSAARARAIASEIATNEPALAGLQEVAVFRRFPASGEAPEEIDFLALLQDELAARGLDYSVVVTQNDSDVFVPMLAGFAGDGTPILDYVEMLDRDAILARADVPTSQAASDRYAQGLPVSVAGESLEIVRGWVSVVASTDTGPFRFVSTHLEDYEPNVQMAQAFELVQILGAETLPTVVVGDFNSRADRTGTPTYGFMLGSGFTDVWTRANPRDPGYSCCTPPDLHDTEPLTERLDLVLVRQHGHAIKGLVTAKLVGLAQTPEGVWPSDHAGLVAGFRIP
jgi:endonuclease/exonuclease/phosphatase family metal-dependent hydrolase